jgi:hypothetical protein
MDIILNNPYRIVGLLVGASAAEQRRQLSRLQRFLEAEKEPEEEFSFPTLGQINRTLDSVNEAASKLNLDIDKINAALFWFYNGNPITDEPAFDAIKEADLNQVINIWTKLTSNGEVSQRNASAFSNLGTLYLSGILEGTNTNEGILEQGILLKLTFLESDFIKDFKALATDETYKTTKKELQLLFLNQLQTEVEKSGTVTSNKFIDILTKQEFSAKEDFLKGFVKKPIEQIEKKIEESKSKRKANKANAIKLANGLLADTNESILQLKSILGASNLKYGSIADKLAMEFFACGRDHFMHFKDTSTDPGENTMKLFKNAKSFAIGNIAKQQIDENIRDLQKWINDKPNRELNRKVGDDVEFIINNLKLADETLKNKGKYPQGYDDPYSKLPLNEQPHNKVVSTQNNELDLLLGKHMFLDYTSLLETDDYYINLFRLARDTVKKCKPKLDNIQILVGSHNELFQKLSNDVASISLACLIDYVNNGGNSALGLPLKIDEHEINVMNSIGELEMNFEMRKRYNEQKNLLIDLQRSIQKRNSSTSRSSSGSGGCYIATMAYGSYDHPQVMVLRQFRDEVLEESIFGRWFIKIYYQYSPKLVEKLKGKEKFNIIIRNFLNQVIKILTK